MKSHLKNLEKNKNLFKEENNKYDISIHRIHFKNKINNIAISINNFISMDLIYNSNNSEYRPNLIYYEKINDIFKENKYLIDKLNISENYYFSTVNQKNELINKKINYKNICIFNILIFLYYEFHNLIEKHNNELILLKYENIKNIKKIFLQNTKEYNNIVYKLIHINDIKIGVKISPVNFIYNNVEKYLFNNIWKEIYINSVIVNSLIENNVSSGFSFYFNYFKIKNCEKELYTNSCILKKYKLNEYYNKFLFNVEDLLTAQNELKNDYNILTNTIENNLLNVKKMIKSNIISKDSIFFITENKGRTIFNYIRSNKNILNDENEMMKIIFKILYNIYCLNIKGIIHNDLHLHNIVIDDSNDNKDEIYNLNNNFNYNILDYFEANDKIASKSFEAKTNETNNKNLKFKFTDIKTKLSIIDFNWSVIMLSHMDLDLEENKKSDEREIYISQEKEKLKYILNNIFNENEQINNIDYLTSKKNFKKFFIYYSVYDIILSLGNISELMDLIKFKYNIQVSKKISKLLKNINSDCLEYLNFLQINDFEKLKPKTLPVFDIINKYFSDFILTKPDNNENVYSLLNI